VGGSSEAKVSNRGRRKTVRSSREKGRLYSLDEEGRKPAVEESPRRTTYVYFSKKKGTYIFDRLTKGEGYK